MKDICKQDNACITYDGSLSKNYKMFGIENSFVNSVRKNETSFLDLEALSKIYLDKPLSEFNIIEIYNEIWKY